MSDKGTPGRIDKSGKQGTFRESRVSEYHEHNDGTKGYDIDIVDREYYNNQVVRESGSVERIHTNGSDRPKNSDDSQTVREYQNYQERQSDGGGRSGK